MGESAIVVGHDWGALLVQTFAFEYPAIIRSLVLMSVPFFAPTQYFSPTAACAYTNAGIFWYQDYMNGCLPGPKDTAITEVDADLFAFIKGFYWSASFEPQRYSVGWAFSQSRRSLRGVRTQTGCS